MTLRQIILTGIIPDDAEVVWGPDFGIGADLVTAASIAHAEKVSALLAAAGAVSHAEKTTAALAQGSAITSHAETVIAARTAQADITLAQHSTSPMLAGKDSWCDVIAACPVDLNRDGTDLACDGIAATRKDIMVGWDLSGFPTGATVTAATVTLNTKAGAAVNANLTLSTISTANEAWAEATVSCSTIPAAVATANTPSMPSNTDGEDTTWVLNAAGLAALQARMGVGSFSLRGTRAGTGTVINFQSADEGTANDLGPRLTFAFTVAA